MGSNFVQPSDLILSSPQGCRFEDENGVTCGLQKTLARGFCQRHYRQLSRLGVFDKLSSPPSETNLDITNAERLVQAKSILQRAAPRVARFAIKTAKAAIDKGDIKPAAWILLHSGAIDPVEKRSPIKSTTGVVVNVGVKLAGVNSAEKKIVIENSADDDDVIESE